MALAVRERLFVTDGVEEPDCEGDVVGDIAWDDVEDTVDERDGTERTILRIRLLEVSACAQCEEKQNKGNGKMRQGRVGVRSTIDTLIHVRNAAGQMH